MSILRIHPEVEGEILEAAKWYQAIDADLALRFTDEIYSMIDQAHRSPLLYRVIEAKYRRVLGEAFPYRLIFEVTDDLQEVYILAVMHQKRHPDAWKDRIQVIPADSKY